jgi:hypothetical protein
VVVSVLSATMHRVPSRPVAKSDTETITTGASPGIAHHQDKPQNCCHPRDDCGSGCPVYVFHNKFFLIRLVVFAIEQKMSSRPAPKGQTLLDGFKPDLFADSDWLLSHCDSGNAARHLTAFTQLGELCFCQDFFEFDKFVGFERNQAVVKSFDIPVE